ncbi:MAG: trigger factor, partial [Clostridia bacterium]|nr:trigger factor [Clostridia bacterium]
MTMDALRADMRPQAEKDVKTRLTLEAIIKAENLEVSDEEVDAKLSEMADRIGKPLDEYKKNIPAQQLEYIKSDVLYTKLVDLLMSKNKFAKAKSSK